MIDVIKAKGHYNVKATHKTTLEVTKDSFLTPRGDCIIGINADKGASQLDERVKDEIRRDTSYIYAVIVVNGIYDIVSGRGSSQLQLTNPNKIIIRKSTFISDSTIMLNADKSAKDIDRRIIKKLQQGSDLTLFIITSNSPLKNEEILRIIINSYPISLT